MDRDTALARLRNPDSGASAALARLLVDDALSAPIRELVEPGWLASQIAAGLEAATRTDRVRVLAEQAIADAMARWGDSEQPLREHVPSDLIEPLNKALSHPYVPSEALVWRLVDQPVFRTVMAEVLESSIKGFRARVSGVDDKLFGGMARRAAQRGRGLFGGVAESVVGAVAGEVEHQFDKRLGDFLSNATTEALRVVAKHVANERHARAYAEVRVGMANALLDTPVSELVSEVEGAQPLAYVDVVLEGLRSTVSAPDFVAQTTSRIGRLLDEVGDGSFGAWLDDVGLREVWTSSTSELLGARFGALVQTDGFADWFGGLFDGE